MAIVGRNMKIEVAKSRRGEVRAFYGDVLSCTIQTPMEELDVFNFADGFSLGIYYVRDDEALDPGAWRRAPWIEIVVEDLDRVSAALTRSGYAPFEYTDREHDYYAGPGGLVFRLASSARVAAV